MRKPLAAAVFVAVFAVFAPFLALAQGAPNPDVDGLDAFIQWYFDALAAGGAAPALIASAGVVLVVHLVRVYGGRFFPRLADPRVAVPLALVASVAGALLTAAVAGQAITLGLLVRAVVNAILASGVFSAAQVYVPGLKVQRISAAGEAGALAAAKVSSVRDALNELGK